MGGHAERRRRRGDGVAARSVAPWVAPAAVALALAAALASEGALRAEEAPRPLLHPLFADHAVLPRDRPLAVWGWTTPGAAVSLRLDDGPSVAARADGAGRWRAALPALAAGGPHTLRVASDGRTQTAADLVAGDLFLCSGQSNMEMQTRWITNAYNLLAEAGDPNLRLFQVSRRASRAPQESFSGGERWTVDAAATAADFSAVCYLFGRALRRTQEVPIGLVNASWGATPIESWLSAEALRAAGQQPPPADAPLPEQPTWGDPTASSVLHHGMFAPLGPFGARAVLWYQGEANAHVPEEYARLLPALLADWRRQLADPRLEVYVVQLAAYGAPAVDTPTRDGWGHLREVQRRVVNADAHAGLVVTVDVGDRHDIHPGQKQVVAERLARHARRRLYGEAVASDGPGPVAARREGESVVVTLSHGPLRLHSGNQALAFELCDAARTCRFVAAAVAENEVRLGAARASDAFVRFCWGDSPLCNLFDDAELPAVPFELPLPP